ncbi:MAG: histidine kinase N-terminal 7TM domain-containing protein [Candidatus Moranbacteria bacterium]|nr:histidine kinase N-terminal 7TM domain-containing protein [Candidatus Moranbacteria bacterium]
MILQYSIIVTTSLLLIFSFALGIFSLSRNPKSKIMISWFLASMAVTIWSLGYLLSTQSPNETVAFYTLKIVYFGASLIPIFTFNFIVNFLYLNVRLKYLLYAGYIIGFIFLLLNTGTTYVISGSRYLENFGRYEEIATPYFYIFLLYFGFFTFFSIGLLINAYFKSDGIRKRQIFFISIALIIGFGGGISNFVTDLTGIYPYGQMVVWLYPVLVTYGIFVDEFKFKLKFN